MSMTAAVSVSQQSAHVNQHNADKDLYFDWMCAELLILTQVTLMLTQLKSYQMPHDGADAPISQDDFIKRALGFQRHK